MAFWTSLISRLIPQHSTCGNSPSISALLQLPNELFLDILDFLDARDRASLSLCNRCLGKKLAEARTASCIGDRNGSQRAAFLSCLARDKPTLFFCHTCQVLHPRAKVPPPGCSGRLGERGSLRCVVDPDCERQLYKPLEIHGCPSSYQFTFQHLHLAMERYHRGSKYGLDLDALSMVEVVRDSNYEGMICTTTLLSVEPKIVHHELLLRIQQWMMFDTDDLSGTVDKFCVEICSHINRDGWTGALMSNLIRCKLQQSDRKRDCPTCHHLLRCGDCGIEFHVGIRKLDFCRGRALVITKWLNLEAGDDPNDPRWRRHLYDIGKNVSESRLIPASADEGERADFENERSRTQAGLTDEMAAVLQTDAFMHLFTRLEWVDSKGYERSANVWTRVPGWVDSWWWQR